MVVAIEAEELSFSSGEQVARAEVDAVNTQREDQMAISTEITEDRIQKQ